MTNNAIIFNTLTRKLKTEQISEKRFKDLNYLLNFIDFTNSETAIETINETLKLFKDVKHLSNATIVKARATFIGFLRVLEMEEVAGFENSRKIIEHITHIKTISQQTRKPIEKHWHVTVFNFLMKHIRTNWMRTVIKILWATSLRINEVWEIDFNHLINNDFLTYIIQPKTQTQRSVYIPDDETLNAIIEGVDWDLRASIIRDYEDIKNNRAITLQVTLCKLTKKFKKEYPNFMGRIHAHIFRHTAITGAFERGANIFALKEFAGHTSIKTTETVYIKNSINHKTNQVLSIYKLYNPNAGNELKHLKTSNQVNNSNTGNASEHANALTTSDHINNLYKHLRELYGK